MPLTVLRGHGKKKDPPKSVGCISLSPWHEAIPFFLHSPPPPPAPVCLSSLTAVGLWPKCKWMLGGGCTPTPTPTSPAVLSLVRIGPNPAYDWSPQAPVKGSSAASRAIGGVELGVACILLSLQLRSLCIPPPRPPAPSSPAFESHWPAAWEPAIALAAPAAPF